MRSEGSLPPAMGPRFSRARLLPAPSSVGCLLPSFALSLIGRLVFSLLCFESILNVPSTVIVR